mgnify:CR=1 FL=1
MLFKDRFDAGQQLANQLKRFENDHPLILLVPRGGVEVGLETIRRYQLDWDFMIPRKIGAPHNKEIAIGAVTMDGNYLLYEEYINQIDVSSDYIQEQIQQEMIEIKRRKRRHLLRKISKIFIFVNAWQRSSAKNCASSTPSRVR